MNIIIDIRYVLSLVLIISSLRYNKREDCGLVISLTAIGCKEFGDGAVYHSM